MNLLPRPCSLPLRRALPALVTILALAWAVAGAAEINPFASDGCSLFPDGTLQEADRWLDCCQAHDIAYWQGGSEEERLAADAALRDCVAERTGDAALAETMYLGVRAGGSPAFPTWYRWGYGWPYGRGYQPLTDEEKGQVRRQLEARAQTHPQSDVAPHRPAAWATPVPSEHLENFYRLDARVYRAAQPNRRGFAELKALGIGNVLNLREYHSDDDGDAFGLHFYRVEMAAGSITTEEVVAALRIIRRSEGPILIHCWHGSDRTGLVSAMYRIVFQGWPREEAIDELLNGGYGHHARLYRNIPEFIRQADIEAIRKEVFAPD